MWKKVRDFILIFVFIIAWVLLFRYGCAIAGSIHKGWNYLEHRDVAVLIYVVDGDCPIAIITDEDDLFRWAVNISNDLNRYYSGRNLTPDAAKKAVEKVLRFHYWT